MHYRSNSLTMTDWHCHVLHSYHILKTTLSLLNTITCSSAYSWPRRFLVRPVVEHWEPFFNFFLFQTPCFYPTSRLARTSLKLFNYFDPTNPNPTILKLNISSFLIFSKLLPPFKKYHVPLKNDLKVLPLFDLPTKK